MHSAVSLHTLLSFGAIGGVIFDFLHTFHCERRYTRRHEEESALGSASCADASNSFSGSIVYAIQQLGGKLSALCIVFWLADERLVLDDPRMTRRWLHFTTRSIAVSSATATACCSNQLVIVTVQLSIAPAFNLLDSSWPLFNLTPSRLKLSRHRLLPALVKHVEAVEACTTANSHRRERQTVE